MGVHSVCVSGFVCRNVRGDGSKMKKEILTIEEAAEYLQIGKKSMYKLVKEGNLPGRKVLNKWRFEKSSLRKWIRERGKES